MGRPEAGRPDTGRLDLLAALARYADRFPNERDLAEQMRAFVERRPDCLERSCAEGHITASAWIVSADRRSTLLTHHRKLGMWLQPGGHADGEADTSAAALREAREETGLRGLALVETAGRVEPFDIDIHRIPARPGEPAHLHYDVRYLVLAPTTAEPVANDESEEVRWIEICELADLTREESVLRMARKASLLLAS